MKKKKQITKKIKYKKKRQINYEEIVYLIHAL